MSGITVDERKDIAGDLIKIEGGTDDTAIGNTGDSLRVRTTNTNSDPVITKPSNYLLDSTGRHRTSESFVLVDSHYGVTDRALLTATKVVGAATVTRNSNKKAMELAVTTASGDRAVLQSRQYVQYIPGQSFLVMQTAVFDAGAANCVQRIGYFDDNNGLFFQKSNTSFSVNVRSDTSGSVVDTSISQASFNLDTMDGNGASGVTLDTTKDNVYIIDFVWLGTGKIRFGILYNGEPLYFHEIDSANVNTVSYMATPSLPVRQEILNNAAISSAQTLTCFCYSVLSEGEAVPNTQSFATPVPTSFVTVGTASFIPLVSVRLKSTAIRGQIIPINVSVLGSSNKELYYAVILNGTLTGPSWTAVGADSIAEYDRTATAITGGQRLQSFSAAGSSSGVSDFQNTFFRLLADVDGTADTLTVAAVSFATTGSAWGAINFNEVF